MTVVLSAPARKVNMAGSTGRLRLTRRGRVVFGALAALLVTAVLFVAAAAFGATSAVASADKSDVAFGYVTVPAGASLWNIAEQLDPKADPRDVITDIVQLNQLSTSNVWAGDVLAVPLQYKDAPGVIVGVE